MSEIEQLKAERDAAIEAGLELAQIVRGDRVFSTLEQIAAVAAVEALAPKPKPFDAWCLVGPSVATGRAIVQTTFPDEEAAEREKHQGLLKGAAIVHLREVTEPPKFERWECTLRTVHDQYRTHLFRCEVPEDAEACIAAHNAELDRWEAAWKGEA